MDGADTLPHSVALLVSGGHTQLIAVDGIGRYRLMIIVICGLLTIGLQMVLATPQKLLQTIAPYVGGITTVENPTRRLTQIAEVMWEDEEK